MQQLFSGELIKAELISILLSSLLMLERPALSLRIYIYVGHEVAWLIINLLLERKHRPGRLFFLEASVINKVLHCIEFNRVLLLTRWFFVTPSYSIRNIKTSNRVIYKILGSILETFRMLLEFCDLAQCKRYFQICTSDALNQSDNLKCNKATIPCT